MKQQKMLNTNKGITLIALVITIIVMLILVAVTISMAVNGGLFDYAGKSVGDTKNAMDAEQDLGSGKIQVDGIWYDSIDDYIAGIQSEDQSEGTTGGEENNTPVEAGISITPTEIMLKKKETGAVGDEVLTGTLTASVYGMESEPEITWEKSSAAIDLSATLGKSITVEAVGTENAEITVTAKCTYEGKEYTAESKIKLEIIRKITAQTMQSNLASYLGKPINYGATYTDASNYGQGKWEIFYADEEHIYLITKGHLADGTLSLTDKNGNEYNGTVDFTAEGGLINYPAVVQGVFNKTYDPDKTPPVQYEGVDSNGVSYDNMRATQYLLDSRNWSAYVNEYADWAIGGPTMELFISAFNSSELSSSDVTLEPPTEYGYASPSALATMRAVPHNTFLNQAQNDDSSPDLYWIAAPHYFSKDNVFRFNRYGLLERSSWIASQYFDGRCAFRPVVCLDSGVQIAWDWGRGHYEIFWSND